MANGNCGYTKTGPKYDEIREAGRRAFKKWLQKQMQEEMLEMEQAVKSLINNVAPTDQAIQANSEAITALARSSNEYHDATLRTLSGEDAIEAPVE